MLIRLPYNKDAYRGAIRPAEIFAGQGYAVVVQDTRGKNKSEGEYEVQNPDRNDGYDAIDWVVKQPWSTGKVGTYGCSYLGEVQYLLAKMHHPNHTAAIAQAASGAVGPAGGYYTDFGAYDGGAFLLSTGFGWFGSAGSKVKGARAPANLDFPTLLRSLPTVEMGKRAGYTPSELEEFISNPPPCSSMTFSTEGMPRPAPNPLVVNSGSRIFSIRCAGIPGPLSSIVISAPRAEGLVITPICGGRPAIAASGCPLYDMASTAFVSKLPIARLVCSRSIFALMP